MKTLVCSAEDEHGLMGLLKKATVLMPVRQTTLQQKELVELAKQK